MSSLEKWMDAKKPLSKASSSTSTIPNEHLLYTKQECWPLNSDVKSFRNGKTRTFSSEKYLYYYYNLDICKLRSNVRRHLFNG
jgi:hypothetical protein